jgi:hydrogenase maturation protease
VSARSESGTEPAGTGQPGRRVAVLGVGNVLMADDAFGPYVIRALEAEYLFPDEVALVDVGTPGAGLLSQFGGQDLVIVLDTVTDSGSPGEIIEYSKEQLLHLSAGPRTGPHEPSLTGAIQTSELEGTVPTEVKLIGVVPMRVETGVGLSPPVRAAVSQAGRRVMEQLHRFGFHPVRRTPPGSPDIWWERQVSDRTASYIGPEPAGTA